MDDRYPANDMPGLEDATSLSDLSRLGPMPVCAPTVDIDGDGVPETAVWINDSALIVMSDHTGDGVADALTVVDDGGGAAAWDFRCGPEGIARWRLRTTNLLAPD